MITKGDKSRWPDCMAWMLPHLNESTVGLFNSGMQHCQHARHACLVTPRSDESCPSGLNFRPTNLTTGNSLTSSQVQVTSSEQRPDTRIRFARRSFDITDIYASILL